MGKTSKLRLQLSTLLLALVAITQCSGDNGLSDKVDFVSRNKEPIVINGDISVGLTDTIIVFKAPWFLWQYRVNNNSPFRVVVPTAKFKVATRRNGVRVKKEIYIDPNQFCGTGGQRTFLIVADPGEEYTGSIGCNPMDPNERMTQADGFERWFISDLGASDSGIYNVEIEVVGWFEDAITNELIDRYQDSDYLITR